MVAPSPRHNGVFAQRISAAGVVQWTANGVAVSAAANYQTAPSIIADGSGFFGITPAPYQPGGPAISMGGSSEPAARRAARLGDGFMPSDPEVWAFYVDECAKLGKPDPGPWMGGDTSVLALADDADKGWDRLAPYFLHEMNAYGAWQAQDGVATNYKSVSDTDELKATGQYRVITPDQYIEELKASPFPFGMFHPLCGGTPPDLGWETLRLFEEKVLPVFA